MLGKAAQEVGVGILSPSLSPFLLVLFRFQLGCQRRLAHSFLAGLRQVCFAEMGPPHHHPGHRMPHPGINEHPPWGGPQHPDFGPPPHGFNGQPPHMRRQGPPHINHDDPSLVPNVPYFDLPAGLMAPLVKVMLPS